MNHARLNLSRCVQDLVFAVVLAGNHRGAVRFGVELGGGG